jgi:hypothetical protein
MTTPWRPPYRSTPAPGRLVARRGAQGVDHTVYAPALRPAQSAECSASVAGGRMPSMVELPSPVPESIQGLPRDHRGYPIPAENDWDNGAPLPLDRQDWRRSAMLGLFGRCAICGCKLKTGEILYRPLGDKDREAAQQFGGCVNQEGPTHLVCSLFSAMICPFFATPNARHSKGVARGRLAAVLGFRRIQVHRTSDGAEFVYRGLIDTIPFKDPSVLAGRLANEVSQRAGIDVVDRMYWRSDDELAPAWEEAEKHLAGGSP